MGDVDPIAALEAELATEREALRVAEEARDNARRVAVLKDEIETAKRQRFEAETLAKLEAEHGLLGKEIERVDTIDGLVVVKRCDGVKVRKWQDQHGDDPTSDALRELARPCVVHPPPGDFDAIVAARPVVMVHAAGAVLKLAGLRVKDVSGK